MMNISIFNKKVYQLIYQFVLVYYWLILYIPATRINVEKYSIWYFIIIIPTYTFILLNLINILKFKHSIQSTYLAIFALIVLAVSLVRLDIATAYNVLLFSLALIGIFNSEIKVPSRFIISLFYLSIILGWITHLLGLNYYNIFPDLSQIGSLLNTNASTWRVSLFPSAPSSAFFALVVFYINYYYVPSSFIKKLTFSLSLYFVILGGSRTGIIILIFLGIFIFTNKFISIKRINFYKFFNLFALAIFVLIINLSTVLFYFSTLLTSDFMNELLFRSKGQVENESTIIEKNSRQIIWQSHLELFGQSPIIGKGTYSFYKFFPNINIVGRTEKINVSESFITDWLARIGLMLVPFLLFLFSLQTKALSNENKAQYSIVLALFITLLTYGSFMTPYSFMFYLFYGSLNNVK